jgi:3-oxoacyl-[acyl-carrier protein] reductase
MSRSVLVTGGNRGIGRAVASVLAADGDRVAVTHRSGDPPAGVFAARCDVTDPHAVDAAVAEVESHQGPVEVLVSNAGITRDGLLLAGTEEDFRAVLETNLLGAVRVARRVLGGMVSRRWGRLIFISSVMGFTGSPGQTSYAASKSALLGLARSLAWEAGGRGITANLVMPGLIDTDLIRPLSAARREQLLASTPLRRVGSVCDVAAAVRFLASADAGYITGAVLPVTGGLGAGQ